MATYTDKGLMMGSNLRSTVLNSGDSNTISSAHTLKASTTMGGLSIDQSIHNTPADASAGKLSVIRGDGEFEVDAQVLTLSRTGGTAWNSLTMRGPEHTSSVMELVDGVDKHLGQANSHGARTGFCGVSAHTGSIAAGGLGVERNEAFFLQVGAGTSVTNVFDVAIADGEVYFYQALRSVDSDSFVQVNTGDVSFTNINASHNTALPISGLYTYGLNSLSASKEYASIKGFINSDTATQEQGRLQFNFMRYGTSVTGLEIYGNASSETLVKIANSYTLPTADGGAGQFITADGAGGSSWTTFTEVSTLDDVVQRGSTTTRSISTGQVTTSGRVLPSSTNVYSLGAVTNAWSDLYLGSGAKVWFASDTYLEHISGQGINVEMIAEGAGEPALTLKSDSSTGATFALQRSISSSSNPIGNLTFTAPNDAPVDVTYSAIKSHSLMLLAGFEQSNITFEVMGNGILAKGLEVVGAMSIGNPEVKISDAYTLPTDAGSPNYVLVADGSGGSFWQDVGNLVAGETLQSVTDRDATTTQLITTGGLASGGHVYPSVNGTYDLGQQALRWANLHMDSNSTIYFGQRNGFIEASLKAVSGVGLDLFLDGANNGEPRLRLRSDTIANTTGPTLALTTDATTSAAEVVGKVDFQGHDSANSIVTYATIEGIAETTTTSVYDGGVAIKTAVNGTLTEALTIDNAANTGVKTLTASGSSTTMITLEPSTLTNYLRITQANSTQIGMLSIDGNGSAGNASIIGTTQTGIFGSAAYKGARFGYSGDASWATALGAPDAELFFLQTGNNTDGIKNVMSVPVDDNAATFHGEVKVSGVEYDTNPTLSFVNDKGVYDLQISTDDSASTVTLDGSLAGLTINTSTAALSTLTLDSSNIVLDGSTGVHIYDNGTKLYTFPNSNDPATSGHVLVGGGVGSSLTFTTALSGLSSVSSTLVTAPTLNVDTITSSGTIAVSKPLSLGSGSDITLASGADITGLSSNIYAAYIGTTQGAITYLASTSIETTQQRVSKNIDVGGGLVAGDSMPSWAAYNNASNVSGVMLQQVGSNLFVTEDNRTGYWLIARDSNATNAPADPSDVAWVIQGMDSSTETMHNLYFRRTVNAGSTLSLIGYLNSQQTAGQIDFTGQHRSVKSESAPVGIESMIGCIVVSDGTYANLDGVTTKPTINEALPRVTLSSAPNQKSVYGVISDSEDENDTERHYGTGAFVSVFEKSDNRLIINAVGEGAVWVTNIGGPIENGDFITSSLIPGYGMKQGDDLMHNYTVAKSTQDCDFDLESEAYTCEEYVHNGVTYKRALIGCTYHCG